MSHTATNWAVQVRGISAHAKVVLWHLADRHNKDTGRCDPSQELLAADCEMSRSGLNNQLDVLEQGGFIKRIRRVNSATKRKESTYYILNFDVLTPQDLDGHVHEMDTEAVSTKQGKPCPSGGQSRVHEMDINPVREPGKNLTRVRASKSSDDFWAESIRSAKPGTAASVSAVRGRELIAKGLVTEAECRKAGVL